MSSLSTFAHQPLCHLLARLMLFGKLTIRDWTPTIHTRCHLAVLPKIQEIGKTYPYSFDGLIIHVSAYSPFKIAQIDSHYYTAGSKFHSLAILYIKQRLFLLVPNLNSVDEPKFSHNNTERKRKWRRETLARFIYFISLSCPIPP